MGIHNVTINIGLFFDGTGNNAFNTFNMLNTIGDKKEILAEGDAENTLRKIIEESFNLRGNEANSYSGYFTNIYWLSELYRKKISSHDVQLGIYIEGVGTAQGKPDALIGQSFGILDTGIVEKCNSAISQLKIEISKAIVILNEMYTNRTIEIQTINFDLFGFSRGAAAVRNFANYIHSKEIKIIDAIKAGVKGTHYKEELAGTIRFIGIFDTVSAIGTIANGWDPHSKYTGEINLDMPKSIARNVFHITAENECRYNFPLNSIKKMWPEYALPGVHSDIGGGYLPVVTENIFLTRPETETVSYDFPNEQTGVYIRALNKAAELEGMSNIKRIFLNSKYSIETWHDARLPLGKRSEKQKRTYAAVAIRERTVRNDWPKIALRIMLSVAKEAGVSFEMIDGSCNELDIPKDLDSICEKAISNGLAVFRHQPPEDFNDAEMNIISQYLHCSANWNSIKENKHGDISGGAHPFESISFINRPDEHWLRCIYDE